MIKYCLHCGKSLLQNVQFCKNCVKLVPSKRTIRYHPTKPNTRLVDIRSAWR